MTKVIRNIVTLALLFITGFSFAQKEYPVKWTASVEQTSDNEATLVFTAKLDKGWHMYSQFTPDGGPIATAFTFTKSISYSLVGKTSEPKPEEKFDKDFGVKVLSFMEEATFRQKIKINDKGKFTIPVKVDYETCTDRCLFLDTSFVLTINANAKAGAEPAVAPVKIKIDSSAKEPVKTNDADVKIVNTNVDTGKLVLSDKPMDIKLEPGCGEEEGAASSKSLLGVFIAGMLGGFLALLTPCVFPMIPLTVSFFTKRSGSRRKGLMNALTYAASIIIIYVALGFLITVTLGSDALNDLASNGYFNMGFFIVFIIFAISFFGAFEITLPSSFINKADQASEKGGLIGIFFMAFTLSLVSFSCTGPIIGTLLVEAAHGSNYMGPLVGMAGFSSALALPFALFSMFPGWLSSLPKSGGWLNTVKVCLGFIELALAMKFLSNVDLAYHWDFLKREIFIALWVIIFGLMGLYLLGKIHFSHDSPASHLSIGRLCFSILTLSFTLYLIPGLWGAPLRLISGFPPPSFYKEWSTTKSECPLDLPCFHDYNEGMAYAKKIGKPALIDFTGWACVNCRKMEENVWPVKEVFERLSDKYVLISLYVDDKTELPITEQSISSQSGTTKKIKTLGNKWSSMEDMGYDINSQPFYVLLDNHGKILAKPRGYTPDAKLYTKYLDEGLCRYKLRKANEAGF
jgi:thiol:disulfide interchange protein